MGSEHNFSTKSPLFKKLLASIRKNVMPAKDEDGNCAGYVYYDRQNAYYRCNKCRLRVDITVDPPEADKDNLIDYAHERKM